MGVSENSVPLNPMVLLIIIPMKNGYFIGNIPNIFRQTHMKKSPDISEVMGFWDTHQHLDWHELTDGSSDDLAELWIGQIYRWLLYHEIDVERNPTNEYINIYSRESASFSVCAGDLLPTWPTWRTHVPGCFLGDELEITFTVMRHI